MNGLLGLALHLRVDHRANREAAAVEGVLAVLAGRAEARRGQQGALDVVADERELGVAATVLLRLGLDQAELRRLGRRRLLGGDHRDVARGHSVEHVVASLQRDQLQAGGARVGAVRVADHAGQHGGLLQVELAGVDAEEVHRGGLDAVGAVAVVGDVQVELEDLVLGVLLLQRDRVAQLLDLAGDGVFLRLLHALRVATGGGRADLRHLHVLLGEGRGALGVAADGADQGAHGALQIHRAVLEEAVVLDRDLRLLHDRGDLVEGHVLPVLDVEVRQRRTVGQQDPRPLRLGRRRQLGGQ